MEKTTKWPKWLKISLSLSFGFLFLVILLVFFAHQMEPKAEITTWEQWEKHREYIKSFSNNVIIYDNPLTMHLKSNDYYKDGFYNNCNIDVCSEYKGFIRTAREASSDGILTPQDLVMVAEQKVILEKTITGKDLEFKNKFKKR